MNIVNILILIMLKPTNTELSRPSSGNALLVIEKRLPDGRLADGVIGLA